MSATTERTFLAVKPDGVQRGLVAEIIGRFERKGFKLVGLKLMQVTREIAESHYGEHKGKPFFEGLVGFITNGPIVAMAWEGPNVIATARKMMGATNPANAESGTIRGDFSVDIGRNVIHGSDGPESAARELGIFFKADELVGWERASETWIRE
ncbi:MAG: nucleoside-diphosphate kinase [Candidatus Sericytochromatia bacterium]|nr:nucleoside-diphosphate kinase [Candidatus Sericytochromatia bacterium]